MWKTWVKVYDRTEYFFTNIVTKLTVPRIKAQIHLTFTLFMKKILLICLVILLGANSCKKDNNLQEKPALLQSTTVSPTEIMTWFDANPQVKPAPILISETEQEVVDDKQVIRIPIATYAALYFTKENGALAVYAYKWKDENPGAVKYTGLIDSYSFQTKALNRLSYTDGKLNNVRVIVPSPGNQKAPFTTLSAITPFEQLWCYLTDGEWNDGTGTTGGDDGKKDLGKPGCVYFNGGGEGEAGTDDGDYQQPSPGIITWDSNPLVEAIQVSNTTGGGASWGPPPCPSITTPGVNSANRVKINTAGGQPIGPAPDPSGCSTGGGQWVSYMVMQISDLEDPQYDPILPDLLDTAGLSSYPKLKTLVTNLPGFLQQYPNIVNALSYYTGFSTTKVLRLIKPGAGPKIQIVSNLTSANGQSLFGHYDEATKTLEINESLARGLEAAQLTKTIQATALLIAITALHEFVHYGRDVNHLSDVYVDPQNGESSEAGWTFEANVAPYNLGGITVYNALKWLDFYPYNF